MLSFDDGINPTDNQPPLILKNGHVYLTMFRDGDNKTDLGCKTTDASSTYSVTSGGNPFSVKVDNFTNIHTYAPPYSHPTMNGKPCDNHITLPTTYALVLHS